jgi:DNA-binding MarR family transcriptional regulator
MLLKIITRVNRRILKILLIEKASLSEIARKSNTTKANVFHSLKNLEKEDLVRKEIMGRTHIYRFNFLHPLAPKVYALFLEEKKQDYNQKINAFPALLDSLLRNMLRENYQGCIFFGSSLVGKYRDIDVFLMVKDIKESTLKNNIKKFNEKISIILGTRKELESGIRLKDMLYRNIINGIPFGCDDFVLELKHSTDFLRRKDIIERFVIGYREVVSCTEFTEKPYVAKHLEKGTLDITYASLNYFDFFPENDSEAKKIFKKQFGFLFSNKAKQAKEQAEKMGGQFL